MITSNILNVKGKNFCWREAYYELLQSAFGSRRQYEVGLLDIICEKIGLRKKKVIIDMVKMKEHSVRILRKHDIRIIQKFDSIQELSLV